MILPSLYLSGDFVDYFTIDEHYSVFYLADISGHGVSSSLVTVFLKSFISKAKDAFFNSGDLMILSPKTMLHELNTKLLNEKFDKFCTIFYGVLDNEANKLIPEVR